jgi:steroid delta-isomerase-like uncharacterized protein
MSEQNQALVRRWFEIWSTGNLALADQIVATNYVNQDPTAPMPEPGRAGFKQLVTQYRTAFPDLQCTVDEIIDAGDRVVTRWTTRGTHKGDLMGIPPTGKKIIFTGISINRVSNDQVVEHTTNWDALGLLRQLGVVQLGQAKRAT